MRCVTRVPEGPMNVLLFLQGSVQLITARFNI